jgi:hypothetical protein
MNKNLKAELIETYKSMGNRDLKLLKEWEQASNEVEIIEEINKNLPKNQKL